MDNNSGYLYHYTNIESFALILKNHTIRFNSLDKLDDLEEKETSDLKNIGQFVYVSCWTDDSDENIPMWNMYSSLDSGVRIRMSKNMFNSKYTYEELQECTSLTVLSSGDDNYINTLISLPEMFKQGFNCPQAMSSCSNILHRIEYGDDETRLRPVVNYSNDSSILLAFNKLGKYKNSYWKFQKEWRYILYLFPHNINQSPNAISNDYNRMMTRIARDNESQPFPYYDVHIDDAAFNSMEITLSPKISPGNRIIVDSLIKQYNPQIVIKENHLDGLIK